MMSMLTILISFLITYTTLSYFIKYIIIKKILAHYEDALKQISQMEFEEAMIFIRRKSMNDGICKFSLFKLNILIYRRNWVSRNKEFASVFWYKPPYLSLDINQLKDCLLARIRILKKELKILLIIKLKP